MTPAEVLTLIDPVDPDNLQPTDSDSWLAKWCPPILGGDIEALKYTPGIEIVQEFEPDNLPGWWAVEFRIAAEWEDEDIPLIAPLLD